MDLSKVSDQDLAAFASGDMSKVSDEGLATIAAQGAPAEEKPGLMARAWSGAKAVGGAAWEEIKHGHAPNAIEPTTSAQIMMPTVMGSPGMISTPLGVQTSASLGNAATAGIKGASNSGILSDVASSLASQVASGGKSVGKGLLKAGGVGGGIAAGEMIGRKIYHGLLGQ